MTERHHAQGEIVTLREYADVLTGRRWTVLFVALFVAAVTMAYTVGQGPLYMSQADVLIGRQSGADEVITRPDRTALEQRRFMATQAQVARSPVLSQRVLDAVGSEGDTAYDLRRSSSVRPVGSTDLLRVSVSDRDPRRAERLAGEYAEQFSRYRRSLDRNRVRRARESLEAALQQFGPRPASGSELRTELVAQLARLRVLESSLGEDVDVVSRASPAEKVRPQPLRAGFVGGIVGLLAGVLVAFLLNALDRRVRSAEEIGRRLRLPLLGTVAVERRLQGEDARPTLIDELGGRRAESWWRLAASVALSAPKGLGPRVLLVTSAGRDDGAPIAAANIAIAVARSGRRVVLADFDLRRPTLAQIFDAPEGPGAADVALGRTRVDQALLAVSLQDGLGGDDLRLLPAGRVPVGPHALAAGGALAELIHDRLRPIADLVIVLAPSLVEASDAVLTAQASDAVVVIARLRSARRATLAAVRRALDALPVPALGVAVTLDARSIPRLGRAVERPVASDLPVMAAAGGTQDQERPR